MRVKIGDYTTWFGPYHLAEAICFWAPKAKDEFEREDFPEWVDKFGDWIAKTPIANFLQWIYDVKERKIKVKVDEWDLYSADHTLALVILPVLKEYRKSKRYGIPMNLDISYIPLDDEGEEKMMQDWNNILDKMIWSFEQIINSEANLDDFWIEKPDFDNCEKCSDFIDKINSGSGGRYDYEARKAYDDKIQEGLDLFGKHFRSLWD